MLPASKEPTLNEAPPRPVRNEEASGPVIGLVLGFAAGSFAVVDEHGLLAVEEKVASFMEETKPEMIIAQVARTERDKGSVRREPPGGAAYTHVGQRLDQRQRDSCFVQEPSSLLQRFTDG